MFALWWREHAGQGRGQVIDLADLRAAVLDPRPPGARLRPARHRPGANGQRGAVHGAAQRLPGEGRPLARALGERPVDRRAGDDDRRPRGSDRGAVVRRPRRPGRARRTSSTRSSRRGSASATRRRRCWRRSRSTRPRSRPSYSIADIFADPQYKARRHGDDRRPPAARPGEDAERRSRPSARRRGASTTPAPSSASTTARSTSASSGSPRRSSPALRRGRGDLTCSARRVQALRMDELGKGWSTRRPQESCAGSAVGRRDARALPRRR